MDVVDMRKRFEDALLSIISGKRDDNKAFLNLTEYNNRIAAVKKSKTILTTPGSKKTVKVYRMVRKYDTLMIGGKERLIKPVSDNAVPVLYYVPNEDLFDILHSMHSAIGHGGRNRMVAELKTKYCNITKETIMAYLRLCVHCQKKSSHPKKGLVTKPILHSALNSRAQVDLIDMQSQSYHDFHFIMVYQDHLTKFVLLKALKTKRAEEVAYYLFDIYTTFGAPVILHSDNGREFVNSVLTELHAMWNDIKVVHGKPRHSQSQGSVERANRDIEEMLATWMAENNSNDWPSGLKYVQFQKNRAFHSGIGRSPYEAMFGCSARVGLASAGIPYDEIPNLNSEEDFEAAATAALQEDQQINETTLRIPADNAEDSTYDNTRDTTEDNRDDNDSTSEMKAPKQTKKTESDPEMNKRDKDLEPSQVSLKCNTCNTLLPDGDTDIKGICFHCRTQENIVSHRKKSRECLEKQAQKMMKLSNQKFSEVDVGATVRVPVPDVERARGSPRNVLAVITHVEDDLYKLCTESGVLKSKYTRSQFNPCKEKLLDEDQLLHGATEKEITLREAAACASPSGSQGYQRCQCKTKCKTKKSLCKSTGILCNSKCHGSLPCENKADN